MKQKSNSYAPWFNRINFIAIIFSIQLPCKNQSPAYQFKVVPFFNKIIRLKHIFQNTCNPFCDCGSETQTATHDVVLCPTYQMKFNILDNNDFCITQIVPNGDVIW